MAGAKEDEEKVGTRLIEKENTETGRVQWSVYRHYLKNIGLFGCVSALTMQLIYQVAYLSTNYWVSVWTEGKLGDPTEPKYRNLYLGEITSD